MRQKFACSYSPWILLSNAWLFWQLRNSYVWPMFLSDELITKQCFACDFFIVFVCILGVEHEFFYTQLFLYLMHLSIGWRCCIFCASCLNFWCCLFDWLTSSTAISVQNSAFEFCPAFFGLRWMVQWYIFVHHFCLSSQTRSLLTTIKTVLFITDHIHNRSIRKRPHS